jgi:hypothetical protein
MGVNCRECGTALDAYVAGELSLACSTEGTSLGINAASRHQRPSS